MVEDRARPRSAGLLMFRRKGPGLEGLEVLLAHPGGPYFARKDAGWWSLPKGLVEDGEDELAAARREFAEETGLAPPEAGYIALGEVRQKSGKVVVAWAFEGDCAPEDLVSNTFELEWPPRSGRIRPFPEMDRAAWFDPEGARRSINPAQAGLLDRLEAGLGEREGPVAPS